MQRHRYGIALVVALLALVGSAGWLVAGAGHDDDRDHGDLHRAFAHVFHDDDDGSDGWVGVMIAHGDGDGARIVDVIDDSPAALAGLRGGDVVIAVDGRRIDGPRGLTDGLDGREPGETVELEILRDGDSMTVAVELGERPDVGSFNFKWRGESGEEFRKHMEQLGERMGELGEHLGDMDFDFDFDNDSFRVAPFGHGHGRPRLGVELTELTDELREHFGGSPEVGVLVGRLIEGMPAEAAGIRVGDLIESVDGETIGDVGDLIRALDEREDDTLRIGIVRDRRTITIDVNLPEPEQTRRPSGPRA